MNEKYHPHEPVTGGDRHLYKKLLLQSVIIISVLLIIYFWGFSFLSNINLFWQALNPRRDYPANAVKNNPILPTPPFLIKLPPAVKDPKIEIRGYADPALTIKLIVNDLEMEKTATDEEGTFAFSNIPLSEGKNSIYTVAIDATGLESLPSRKAVVEFDKIPPKLEISQPGNKENFEQKEEEITVAGRVEPEIKVTINGQQIIIDQDGSFKTLYALRDGENNLVIKATDTAGNETVINRKVFFSRIF